MKIIFIIDDFEIIDKIFKISEYLVCPVFHTIKSFLFLQADIYFPL